MKHQVLKTTALLLALGSVGSAAIAAPSASSNAITQPHSELVIASQTNTQQKQSAQRDRQRRQELQRRERERQQEAERQERQRDDNNDNDDDAPWWDDRDYDRNDRDDDYDNDDAPWWDNGQQQNNSPWWERNNGRDASQRDRDRQRDAQQRERDRQELEDWQEDRRDDDDDDDNGDDAPDNWDDFRRDWEHQQNLLEWQWNNNWRSSISNPAMVHTQVQLTSLTYHPVIVSIEGINEEIELDFDGNRTQRTVDLPPGAYRIHFRSAPGDRIWQSGYLNIGRTGLLRIVFDQNRNLVQVYDDPYAWTSENLLPF